MKTTRPPFILFTDLDGTLLDPHTYEPGAASGALEQLRERRVPIVLCSSKTKAEQTPLRASLGLTDTPFIVENGSAILVPAAASLPVTRWQSMPCGHHARVLGLPAATVHAGIAQAAASAKLKVSGYANLSVSEVATITGLDHAAAERARCRDFSETLVDQFTPDGWTIFERALAGWGLRSQHGGRFHTVTGAGADKGRAVRVVADLFATAWHGPVLTVAIGNSANDEGMLAAADRGFLLANGNPDWAPVTCRGLHRVARSGPRGWADCVTELLRAT